MSFIKRQLNKLTNDSFLFLFVTIVSIVFLFGTGIYYTEWSGLEVNQDVLPIVYFMTILPYILIYISICTFAWIAMFFNIFTKKTYWLNLFVSIGMVFLTIFTFYSKLIY